ncbi:MAG: hypothetical protein H0V36_09420 [Chloroflexi bacterium]|nr:hypothetical protein [Chloroflexota bacterium]
MPVGRTFRQRVLARELLVGTFLNLGSPAAAEVCAHAGLDWVLVDLEHGAGGDGELLGMLQAIAGSDATALVRVEQATRLRIGRALDLGAEGVMMPRVETAAEATEIATWLRYPPAGVRGVAVFTRGLAYGAGGHASVAPRNDELVGMFQIESRQAVDSASDIAAIDGVDVLFVGPADLSHALGIPGQIDHADYQAAVDSVGRAARDRGKAAGVLLWRPEDVDRYAALGYSFFSVSSEAALMQAAVRAEASDVRSRLA